MLTPRAKRQIKIYKLTIDGKTTTIEGNDLANACLNACGGGFTAEQTADAMSMQSALLSGKEFDAGGSTWRCTEVHDE